VRCASQVQPDALSLSAIISQYFAWKPFTWIWCATSETDAVASWSRRLHRLVRSSSDVMCIDDLQGFPEVLLDGLLDVRDALKRATNVDLGNKCIIVAWRRSAINLISPMLIESDQFSDAAPRVVDNIRRGDSVILGKEPMGSRVECENAFPKNRAVVNAKTAILLMKLADGELTTEPVGARKVARSRRLCWVVHVERLKDVTRIVPNYSAFRKRNRSI